MSEPVAVPLVEQVSDLLEVSFTRRLWDMFEVTREDSGKITEFIITDIMGSQQGKQVQIKIIPFDGPEEKST